MISDSHRFIYVRIPKCASCSVRDMFRKYKTDRMQPSRRGAEYFRSKWGRVKWEEYFTFSFVRNPWGRLVSMYAFLLNVHNRRGVKRKWHGDFSLFLKELYRTNKRCFLQSKWLVSSKGNIMVDFVGRVESFDEDIEKISYRIGIDTPQRIHTNKSNHNNYREYYTKETEGFVSDVCAKDIELFGYRF